MPSLPPGSAASCQHTSPASPHIACEESALLLKTTGQFYFSVMTRTTLLSMLGHRKYGACKFGHEPLNYCEFGCESFCIENYMKYDGSAVIPQFE
ncbi:hypothetical protein CFC21_064984 [Triticum aestivum]|uniref:Uncharacterized protein n=3 Tax=Triticum TaxID=4564 RepID=A0A9R0TLV8_TRITD|nr:hypothetical protein CFC21_064984 [Triticum aestivum]VAI15251.1 unnamed protein product [Triticum turgidum subsp. durum]